MNRCEAPNCRMRTYAPTAEQLKMAKNNYVISFHKFPDDPDKRDTWISAANKPSWRPPMFNSSLCSLHFRDDCFNENNELYDHAVPTIFFDDFGYHMREVVKKLDLECKLDDDDASKTSKESENALNISEESNQSGAQSRIDEEELSYVECEEVVIYDENSKLGIENISIPELEEVTSDAVEIKSEKHDFVPKPTTLGIDSNDIVDVRISYSTNDIAEDSESSEGSEICIVEVDTPSISTKSKIGSSDLSSKSTKVASSTTTMTNLSASSTKPSPLSSVKSNKIVSQPPIKSTVLSNKPATVPATSISSSAPSTTLSRPIFTSSTSTISSSTLSSTSLGIVPFTTQSPRISSSQPSMLDSLLTSTQTKSTPTSSQFSKGTLTSTQTKSTPTSSQFSKGTVTSTLTKSTPTTSQYSKGAKIPPASTAKPTLPSSTPGPSKPTAPLSVSASNSTISRPKPALREQNAFSVMDPASKSLVVQLLNIVKTANASDVNKSKGGPCINSYLVTSKSVDIDQSETCKILPSAAIIELVADYVKAIKDETFVQPKNVSIICGSPAIFLLKNVTVQECDPTMNCVYVITSHNLLPDLYKMKMKAKTLPSSNQQQPTQTTTPSQTSVELVDLVSSANPNAVLSVQNTLDTALNTPKMNTVSKLAKVNSPAYKLTNSISNSGPVRPQTNSNSVPSTTKTPVNNSTSCSSVDKNPVSLWSYSSIKSHATDNSTYADPIEPEPCSRIFNTAISKSQPRRPNFNTVAKASVSSSNLNVPVTKPLVNTTSLNTVTKPLTNSILNATVVKPVVNTSINNVAQSKSLVKISVNNVPVAKPSANTLVNNVALAKPPSNTLVNNVTLAKPPTKTSMNNIALAKPPSNTLINNAALTKPPSNTLVNNVALAKPPSNTLVNNVPLAKPLVSIPISSVVLAKANSPINLTKPLTNSSINQSAPATSLVNISIPNAALAQPSTTNLNSGSRGILNAVASGYSTNTAPTVSKTPSYANFTQPTAFTQTSTIASAITKPPQPATTIVKTFGSIPSSSLSRVLSSTTSTPSTLRSPASTPVAKINTQLIQGVNAYQISQPGLYIVNHTRPELQSVQLPFRVSTAVPAQTPAPPSPAFIPTPPAISAIPSQPPAPAPTPITKSNPLLNSVPVKVTPPTFIAKPPAYNFQPIQPSSFDTNLKTSELLVTYDSFSAPQPSTSSIPSQTSNKQPQKRRWGEVDDDDDDDEDDDDPFFATCTNEEYDKEYLEQQRKEIKNCEWNILQKEREINNLKKKIQTLKKRLSSVRNPNDTKTDEQLVEEILSKYIDSDGVQFFIGQMKVAGKTYTQFRWSEDDKLFALGLLYKNPVEYNVLFQKYTLPSDKTLNKFVNRVKKAELQDSKSTNSR